VKLKLPVVDEIKYQEEPARRRNDKDLKEDDVKLVRKMTEMEMEFQAVKPSKEKMKKFHKEEMRSRDKREMIIFCSVAADVLFYAVSFLLVKGFV
jgi:protein subunit release factor B